MNRQKNQIEKEECERDQESQSAQIVERNSSSTPSGPTNESPNDIKVVQEHHPAIDFVLYLQQTGSIIALAKLMDALDYGEHYDESLDDSELKLIREQQMLSHRATN